MENVGDREKCKWIKLINFRSFIDSCYDFHKSSRIIIHGNVRIREENWNEAS